MKPGHETLSTVQCSKGIHAAGKRDCEVETFRLDHMALQQRKSDVVTGAYGQQELTLIACIGNDSRQIQTEGFDVWLHPSTCAPFCPHQPLSKLRGTGSLSLRPHYERLAQQVLPFSQGIPDVSVGGAEQSGRVANGPSRDYGGQQVKERIVEMRAALLARCQCVLQMNTEVCRAADVQARGSYRPRETTGRLGGFGGRHPGILAISQFADFIDPH